MSRLGRWDFGRAVLKRTAIKADPIEERFGEKVLPFSDLDGMRVELVEVKSLPPIRFWEEGPIPEAYALRGFHSVTLWLDEVEPTSELLVNQMGYQAAGQEGNRYRFIGDTNELGHIVDILHRPGKAEAGFGAVRSITSPSACRTMRSRLIIKSRSARRVTASPT
jgi:glyoxalase family protein